MLWVRRPYLHPHRWATRWTGCCQLLGSGLSQDRRHRQQGFPSRCHRWTWGAWWCWERRRGVRRAKVPVLRLVLCVRSRHLLTAALQGTHCVPTPRPAPEPLRPSLPTPPPQAPSWSVMPLATKLPKSEKRAKPSNASLAPPSTSHQPPGPGEATEALTSNKSASGCHKTLSSSYYFILNMKIL